MAKRTGIGWTDATFNPWWGCEHVSDGCMHCYAETLANRYGHRVWGRRVERRTFGDKHWREPFIWDMEAQHDKRPRLVFCASMADVFEDRPELDAPRARLFDMIEHTPWLRWQLLTKRPQNVMRMVPWQWASGAWPETAWLGCTIEHQRAADERLPIMAEIPARVRFASCEPLLGPVDLTMGNAVVAHGVEPIPLEWVIVGGESGPHYRALDLDHALALVGQCQRLGVPVYFKQVGGTRYHDGPGGERIAGGDLLGGKRIKEFPPEAERHLWTDTPVEVRR